MGDQAGSSGVRKEIYTYEAPWNIYAMGWCQKSEHGQRYRLAVGSFTEEYNNKVQVVQRTETSFVKTGELEHPYPPTKIMWSPDKSQASTDLLATTGDYLRLWTVDEQEPGGVKLNSLLNNNTNAEYCSPLTSFDWCEADPSTVGTSSIDTTCTIWDVTTCTPRTQLIAHDKEVYDIAFARTKDIFASVGADGSVRMFDLRSLEHSTIIYETHDLTPLMRLSWNKQDPNYLATILTDSAKTVILDIRVPSLPVAMLGGHQAAVCAIAWAPHSSCHICTAGDDCQSLIWDLSSVPSSVPKAVEDPILAYTAEEEVNQLQWSASHPEWIAITFANKMQILRV